MNQQAKIAIITTSHNRMGTDPKAEATGTWSEEFTAPYYALTDNGASVDVYSVKGGEIPFDPRSFSRKGDNEASVERYLEDDHLQQLVRTSKPLSALNIFDYDAIFLPGGHGVMWDFSPNSELAEAVSQALGSGRLVASVCHGPAGLLGASDANGNSLLEGRQMAGFSNSEERASGFADVVPFSLETELKARGAHYQSGADFEPFALRNGNLITGQNPASSQRVAELLITALNESLS